MDVDPGKSSSVLTSCVLYLNFFAEIQIQAAPVRILPYSLVPGMLMSSPSFFKAVSIVAKQRQAPGASPVNSNTPVASSSKGKKSATPAGMLYIFLHRFCNLFT